jgi:hypothetical protein
MVRTQVNNFVDSSCKLVLIIFHWQATFEESRLNESDVGDKQKWLKEGTDCTLMYWNGRVFLILFSHCLLSFIQLISELPYNFLAC